MRSEYALVEQSGEWEQVKNAAEPTGSDLRRAPGAASPNDDWWAAWEAIRSLAPNDLSLAYLHGLTGGVARTLNATLTYDDLEFWLLPGLTGIGVRAELIALPEEETEWLRLLRARTRRGKALPLFAFDWVELPAFPEGDREEMEGTREERREEEANPKSNTSFILHPSSLLSQVVVMEVAGDGNVIVRDAAGRAERTTPEALRGVFTHGLLVKRGGAKGRRQGNIRAALGRWASWAMAFPERALSAGSDDTSLRALAADYLREIAGKRHDKAANRLRRAADFFATGRSPESIEEALSLLRTAVCISLHLPILTSAALLAPKEQKLSDLERRELIYLARAGARDLKTLAVWRLASEHQHSDVARTLEQLSYDADDQVRAAARKALQTPAK